MSVKSSKFGAKKPLFSAAEIASFKQTDHPTYAQSSITVDEARELAFSLHKGQTDKANRPYSEHLEAVRNGVEVLGGDAEEQIAALFHDTLEDTFVERTSLRKAGVSEVAVQIIEAVTKPVSAVQSEYLDDIVEAGKGAMRVKCADLMHNLRHDRLAALPEYTRDRLHKKYRPSLARLLMELELIVDEDTQKKLATKPVGSSTYGVYSGTKTLSVLPASLIRGDWATWWKAPLLRRIDAGDEWLLELANGQILSEPKQPARSITVYPRNNWEKDTKITFYGVTEDDIEDFIEVLDHQPYVVGGTH